MLPFSVYERGYILTSEMHISSISASVGAFSRTLGLGLCAVPIASGIERSMHEVDFSSSVQACTRHGSDPNVGSAKAMNF